MNNKILISALIITLFACFQQTCPRRYFAGSSKTPEFEDICETERFPSSFKTCVCPDTGNKGKCSTWPDNGKYYCVCSNDECENDSSNFGKPCRCHGTSKEGSCRMGSLKENLGYRCDCEQPSFRSFTTSGFSLNNKNSSDEKEPEEIHQYNLYFYSSDIDAPILNLPLQRSLAPTTDCILYWLGAAPFFKSTSTKFIENHVLDDMESGIMLNAGIYSWLFMHMLLTIASCKKTCTIANKEEVAEAIQPETFHSVPCDFLIGLGAQNSGTDGYKLNGEFFVARSEERIKEHKELTEMPGVAIGIQGGADFCISEYFDSKYELSSLVRVTHFNPTKSGFTDNKTHERIGSSSYGSGTFLDLFLSLKQYYGIDYQHQIELGYNPTVHVRRASVTPLKANRQIEFKSYTEDIHTLRNTVFGAYAYTWNVGNVSMNMDVGATITIIPSAKTYGIFFAGYSVGF